MLCQICRCSERTFYESLSICNRQAYLMHTNARGAINGCPQYTYSTLHKRSCLQIDQPYPNRLRVLDAISKYERLVRLIVRILQPSDVIGITSVDIHVKRWSSFSSEQLLSKILYWIYI